jgi:hypothetical protein
VIEVSIVPLEHLDALWGQVEPYMEKAAKYTYGRYTVGDIYDSIKEHGYQLWVAYEDKTILGAVATQFITYPKRKALSLVFCGGKNLLIWKDPMLALLQRYAKDMNCDCLESTARKGWAKIFEADGYTQSWVAFELPIKGAKNE